MKLIKEFLRRIVYSPRFAALGEGSLVMLPRWLVNRKHIHVGDRCFIGRFAIFNPMREYNGTPQQGEIIIGDDVYIGGFSQIHSMHTLEIGSGTVLSEHVYISDTAHGLNPLAGPIMQQPLQSKGPVSIGRSVFIGFGASILPGVKLGDHCVVATRAVVTNSFPPYSMVGGIPARLIKKFDVEQEAWLPISERDGNLRK